jgi:acetyltransferase-like isoleucine patch superfamily enzyme
MQRVAFDVQSPNRLAQAGFQVDFRSPRLFAAAFRLERPCVIQASLQTDLPFSMGAFSASYGGRLRHVQVGRYCSLSGGIETGWDDHPTDWVTTSMVGYVSDIHRWASLTGHPGRRIVRRCSTMRGPTLIGNDVWIGHGAFLRAGIRVGDGAVVAARSVVLQDVPPFAVVGGTPARLIRMRFAPDIVAALTQSAWWRYNIFQFDQAMLADPAAFLAYFEALRSAGELGEGYRPETAGPADLARIAGVSCDEC